MLRRAYAPVRPDAEQLIVALLTNFFNWFQNVADFLLVRNISGWTGAAGGG
jgi:hypothetical protein